MKKHLSLFITTAAAVLALAYVLFIFVPRQQRIAGLRQSLQQQQQYVAESTKLVAVINGLEDQLEECRTFIAHWKNEAPSGNKMAQLIRRITAEAEQSRVQLVAFHPAPAERYTMLSEMPASLKVEGSFHSAMEFLGRVEGLSTSIWIPHVKLKPEGEAGQNVSCELTLSIFSDPTDIAD